MLLKLAFNLILSAFVYGQSPTPAPTPSPVPTAPTEQQKKDAEAAGTANGNYVGGQISSYDQQGLSTQSTSYNSLQNSSVDSMMNSQQGEASAGMMSGSLASAAGPYATNCDPNTVAGIEACATGSVLTGMSGQMVESSSTFVTPINLAWNNVCHYSSLGCNAPVIPNPYAPIVQTLPPVTPTIYQTLVKSFSNKGYTIDPKSGIVLTPDGKTINPNSKASINSALKADGKNELQHLLDKMQKDIAQRLSQVKRDQYLAALGLGSMSEPKQRIAEEGKTSDFAKAIAEKERSRRNRYNRLPEKDREKIEIAELVKSYNGTPIGVAAGNIFKMVKKRYEIKTSQKVFLIPELNQFKQTQSEQLPLGR